MEREQDIFRLSLSHHRINTVMLFVCFCRKGSVIVDAELTFDTKVGLTEVSALVEEATKDGRLGEFQVSDVVVGSFVTGKLRLLSLSRKGKGWRWSLKESGTTMIC